MQENEFTYWSLFSWTRAPGWTDLLLVVTGEGSGSLDLEAWCTTTAESWTWPSKIKSPEQWRTNRNLSKRTEKERSTQTERDGHENDPNSNETERVALKSCWENHNWVEKLSRKNYCPIPTQTLGNPHLVQEHNFSPKKRNLLEIWCTSGIDEFQLVGLFITRQSISQAKQKCSKASEPTDRTYEQKGKPGEHTQEHEHTKNDSNFQSPEVTVRLGPHFPTKNSDYTDQFVVHLWTSHSRTTQRRKP